MLKNGGFKEFARRLAYKNKWLRVERADVLRPDGKRGIFGLVYMAPGVIIVAVDDTPEQNVLLVQEFRYALGRSTWSLIAGTVNVNENWVAVESIEDASRRELAEETGFRAASIEVLARLDPHTGIMKADTHVVLARGLTKLPASDRPASEDVIEKIKKVPLKDAVGMTLARGITHGPSVAALFMTQHVLQGRSPSFLSSHPT